MTHGNRTAIRIYFCRIQVKSLDIAQDYGRKGLIHFKEINIIDLVA